jgi:DNA-binding MarR family transcriptional regulator
MGKVLKQWIKSAKEIPVRSELSLNLRVASNLIYNEFEKVTLERGITGTQYNVLRILKGVYPEGHARCGIAERMLDRASDITRIIDRLEKQGLAERDRTEKDRRISITKITEKGLKTVNELNPKVEKLNKSVTKNLNDEECRLLSDFLEKMYEHLTN